MPSLPRIFYYLIGAMRRVKWDHSELRDYQEKRLRHVVRYAYNHVPFYHNKFKKAGISPSDIRTIDDLMKVPITRKGELRRESRDRIVSQEYPFSNLIVKKTSGSTGKPLTLYLAGAEDDWRKAIYMRANICCGQKPWDKWVVIAGPRHFGDTTRIQRAVGIYSQTGISVFDDVSTQLSKISKLKPDILDGYSSSIFLLAKQMQKVENRCIKPRVVFGSAEVIDDSSQTYIEKVFGAPYYDQYGCVELNRTAWQCYEQKGYHMDVDSVITQFVDNEGKEVSAGERGETAFTSLFNYAMPFIRYAVGDVGVPSVEKCTCGIKLPLMKSVEGRKDSFVISPDGRIFSPRTLTIAISMFKDYESIDQFRIVQRKLNVLEIFVKLRDNNADKSTMETNLVAHINRLIHLDNHGIMLGIKFVDHIKKNKSGKLMTITSELKS